jgi:hypothetical protein
VTSFFVPVMTSGRQSRPNEPYGAAISEYSAQLVRQHQIVRQPAWRDYMGRPLRPSCSFMLICPRYEGRGSPAVLGGSRCGKLATCDSIGVDRSPVGSCEGDDDGGTGS